LVFVFLGLISFAAVRASAVDCRYENQRLLLHSGGCLALHQGGCLLLHEQRQRCELLIGDLRISLPPWLQAIIRS
jgi:hypothetical protein